MIIAACLFCLIACDKNDANSSKESWSLISIECECVPVLLEKGDHIWVLDTDEESLEVENNSTLFSDRLLSTGSYAFKVEDDLITIEGTRYQMVVQGDVMTLDSNYPNIVDAPFLTFRKS